MIRNKLAVLILCFYTGCNTYAYNKSFFYGAKSQMMPLSLEYRYKARRYLRLYPKTTDSLRSPEITTLININTADFEQLQQLPTIGPKRAKAIIKYRETLPLQKFDSIEQLLEIQGINTRSFERIRAYIVI